MQTTLRVLVVLFVLGLVVGCGGGGGGTSVRPFDSAAYQQMTVTSGQAADLYASLVNQGSSTAGQQTVDWAKTQPNVVYAEPSSDGGAVWLEFNTGIVQVITLLPQITGEPDSQQSMTYSPTRDAASISGSNKALDLNAAWPGWPEGDNQDFMAMMSARGYDVDSLRAEQVDVQAFSHLDAYSAVHIDTHGPLDKDFRHIGPVFVTREEVTADRDNILYANDLREKDLIQAIVLNPQPDGTVLPYHGYYAITPNFISNHLRGSFPQNSFVFADSCSSVGSNLMAQAFKRHSLGAYAGWSKPVSVSGSCDTASRLFDLLAAANHYTLSGSYPSADGKRLPMNLGNAVDAVKREGFGTLEKVGADLLLAYGDEFEFTFAPGPHLDSLEFTAGSIVLRGHFGESQGKVIIGGTEQSIVSWGPYEIEVNLPSDIGQGDLYVQTPQGVQSNRLVPATAVITFVPDDDGPLSPKRYANLVVSTENTSYTGYSGPPGFFMGWPGSTFILPRSPSAGQTWTQNIADIAINISVPSVSETVSVSAGTFAGCLHVREQMVLPPGYNSGFYNFEERSRWFARGVGVVKYEAMVRDGDGNPVYKSGELSGYSVSPAGASDWWPLQLGNHWEFVDSTGWPWGGSWDWTVTQSNSR